MSAALKLVNLEKDRQIKDKKVKMKIYSIKGVKIGACSCPCYAFRKKGEISMDNEEATASWNID